jgi:hypothetical protein
VAHSVPRLAEAAAQRLQHRICTCCDSIRLYCCNGLCQRHLQHAAICGCPCSIMGVRDKGLGLVVDACAHSLPGTTLCHTLG